MNKRDTEVAQRLAKLASDGEISYEPDGTAFSEPNGHAWVRWYGMTATHVDGRSWRYLLRRESGSYCGDFPA